MGDIVATKPKKTDTVAAHTKALVQHTAALKAHADAMNAFTAAVTQLGKSISRDTIRRRLAHKWGKDPDTVKESDSINKYVKGGPGVMSAYAEELNTSAEFSPDKLNLQTNDTAFVTTVGELIDAIAHWYSTNGWKVTA
jgi:ABC-type nitrate/sulfonate/bicarbonate transport system substrate-binding protein